MVNPIIQVTGLKKGFKKKEVLKDLSFDVYPNEIFGIIGISGAGKSVLFKLLSGFYKPSSGKIKINVKPSKTTNIGYAAQDHHFYPNLTVKENIDYFSTIFNVNSSEIKIEKLLKLVELQESQKTLAKNLSGGMQRRLEFACSMVHNPKILLLDEPTSSLDPILRKHVLQLIQKIRNKGVTILIASHFIDEIEPICTRIGILQKGKLVVTGTPFQIRDSYSKLYEVRLRTHPGNYNLIFKTLSKEIGNLIKNPIVENKELIFYLNQKYSPQYYVSRIMLILQKVNENLLNITIHKSPFKRVFEDIIKNV